MHVSFDNDERMCVDRRPNQRPIVAGTDANVGQGEAHLFHVDGVRGGRRRRCRARHLLLDLHFGQFRRSSAQLHFFRRYSTTDDSSLFIERVAGPWAFLDFSFICIIFPLRSKYSAATVANSFR